MSEREKKRRKNKEENGVYTRKKGESQDCAESSYCLGVLCLNTIDYSAIGGGNNMRT